MSQENVEIARRAFERFLATGPPWDMLDEDIDVHDYDTQTRGHIAGTPATGDGSKTGEPLGPLGPWSRRTTSMLATRSSWCSS
jgi:hypothetical protein